MNADPVTQIDQLLHTGLTLIPEGGSESSGYNAKKQSKYLLWRKNCLNAVSALNDAGPMLCDRIAADEDGMYFYHSSAQHIVTILQEALEIAKVLDAAAKAQAKAEAEAQAMQAVELARLEAEARERERLEAEEQKKVAEQLRLEAEQREQERLYEEARKRAEAEAIAAEANALARRQAEELNAAGEAEAREIARQQIAALEAARTAGTSGPKILIFTLENHVMLKQLQKIFTEVRLDQSLVTHSNGVWNSFELLEDGSPHFGVFLLSDRYHGQELMALGYVAGRYPSTSLCCIHAHAIPLGDLLPGVTKKIFSVSLDEIKLSLIKDLKDAGCSVPL